jgi:cell pole-organizing protein PopZ
MAQAAKNQEPSMEEILASIRRIIAEDDPEKAAQRAADSPTYEPGAEPSSTSPAGARFSIDASSEASAKAEQHDLDDDSRLPPADAIGDAAKANRSPTILDLTDSIASATDRRGEPDPSSSATERSAHSSSSDLTFDTTAAPDYTAPTSSAEMRDGEGAGLLSSSTSAVVDSAFNALAQIVLVQNARSLEDLVREMLRPMLKVWLDDNLPGLVERLVRAEIERVSRGRTG